MTLWAPPTMSFHVYVTLLTNRPQKCVLTCAHMCGVSTHVWSVNSTVTKNSDHFVWKETSERMAQRCDDTIDKKRLNSCVLKHLSRRELNNQKNGPKTPEMLSPMRF